MVVTGFIHHTPSLNKLIAHVLSMGSLGVAYAYSVFTHTRELDILTWNTMLRGFVNSDMPRRALRSYIEMLQWSRIVPDRFTFPSLLKGCALSLEFKVGKVLHGQIVKYRLDSDLYIETTLLNMYASCGDLNSARFLFEKMGHRNKVVWTSMISGYTRNHCPNEALVMYEKMVEDGFSPDEVTMVTLVSASAELKDLGVGMKLHSRIQEMGMKICAVLGSALVDMYAKCGDLKTARQVFDNMSERNVYTFSALIFGYVKNNRSTEALQLFKEMTGASNVRPNDVTTLAVVSACAQLGDLETGRWIHDYITRTEQDCSVSLSNALIDMYSKCGEIDAAKRIFDSMSKRDLISWNSLVNGLALHGLGREALTRLRLMQMTDLQPDEITFIGVLTACSHAGLVQEGKKLFHEMEALYGIRPKLEHYGCMVDLLCRAGRLVEAREFIQAMPLQPNGAIWGAMLGACRVYNDLELGEESVRCLLELEPTNDGVYILLSNIYAKRQMWNEVKKVRELMNEKGIQKTPGYSSVVIDNITHSFLAGDCSHPEITEIFKMLRQVREKLKQAGYVADISEVLLNIDDNKKEESVSQHSEKLALCYGLLKSKPGRKIVILKNLRVCSDCHTMIKLVSKIYRRQIMVRDRIRFHHFKDGVCSCRDYW
ncbi:pentatricopeptide repeat-containing protein At1g08070, chloroplastic-like [Cucurbita moschata]|uniref:Pentatricopeptide repeat-containing protein At1g08070, chloroplastic-like n=1 Tax=Cucurbita moschata TaxID=3662 RepID=A0A6J1E8Q8_CUCMO|nr:pentatricopeptide repeat-containing protein At1g08070, chloroplastic-like [Cucurbita moschata]